jgi:hypothetical protein
MVQTKQISFVKDVLGIQDFTLVSAAKASHSRDSMSNTTLTSGLFCIEFIFEKYCQVEICNKRDLKKKKMSCQETTM